MTVTENAPCAVYHDHDACHSESEYLPVSVYACECYADTGGSFCAEARVYSKHWHGFGAVDRIEIAVQEALAAELKFLRRPWSSRVSVTL